MGVVSPPPPGPVTGENGRKWLGRMVTISPRCSQSINGNNDGFNGSTFPSLQLLLLPRRYKQLEKAARHRQRQPNYQIEVFGA